MKKLEAKLLKVEQEKAVIEMEAMTLQNDLEVASKMNTVNEEMQMMCERQEV